MGVATGLKGSVQRNTGLGKKLGYPAFVTTSKCELPSYQGNLVSKGPTSHHGPPAPRQLAWPDVYRHGSLRPKFGCIIGRFQFALIGIELK
jgi:hypothetical protein